MQMASMKEQADLGKLRSARLAPEQMRAALPRIKQLIAELQAVDVSTTEERGEERFGILEQKIDSSLAAIFGDDTFEYNRFRVETLDTAKVHMMYEIPLYEVKEGYARGIDQAISNLRAVMEFISEKVLEEERSPKRRELQAFVERGLHVLIEQAVAESLSAGKYAEAVEQGCKALTEEVRRKCDKDELRGREFPEQALHSENVVSQLDSLLTEAAGDGQRGILFLLAGAMIIGTSPEGRERISSDSDRTLEFLSLLSFLIASLESF